MHDLIKLRDHYKTILHQKLAQKVKAQRKQHITVFNENKPPKTKDSYEEV